jgi:formate dehydrogenase iron-sulfur subunit
MSVPITSTSTLNLLDLLLLEQGELSAVDRFADWHQSPSIAASTYQALMPTTPLMSGQQYAFEVDLDKCSGCKACVVACHTLNGLAESETWRKVGTLTTPSMRSLPVVQHVTTACHHCVDPGCLNGCPVQAYEKDPVTGIVRHLDDQCFGCKYCTMMCPYEVPQYSSTLGIVRKCDMCSQRLAFGEPPACVQACPNQAIRIAIVDVATAIAEAKSQASILSLVATAPLSEMTIPTTKYHSTRLQASETDFASSESALHKAHDGHLPLVVMIVLTQTSVGMWIVLVAAQWLGYGHDSFFAAAIATLIGVVGVHAALLHLGRPWLAYRAALGWRTSWLSREAIGFGLFMAAALASTASQFLFAEKRAASSIRYGIPVVAAIGLVSVICTGMIYVATRRELWSYQRTSVDFGFSIFGLGLLGAFASLDGLPNGMLLVGVLFLILAEVPKLVDHWRAGVIHIRWDNFSALSGRLLRTELASQWAVLWLLNMIAMGIAIGLSCTHPTLNISYGKWLVFAIGIAAQAVHRWLYFASVVFRRMPGVST